MWNRLLSVCAGLSAFIIAAISVMVSYDVIARNTGLPTVSWIVDLTEYALPFATLLVAPWLAHRGEHIKIDLISMVMPKQAMVKVDKGINFVCGVVCLVIAWYGVSVTLESYETGALVIKNIIFPEWWAFAPLPGCFLILALEFLRAAVVPVEHGTFIVE